MAEVFQKETWPNLYKEFWNGFGKISKQKKEKKRVMPADLILIIAQSENVINQAHPEIYLICPTLLLHHVT